MGCAADAPAVFGVATFPATLLRLLSAIPERTILLFTLPHSQSERLLLQLQPDP